MIVAIDGPDAAGKTTFADRLAGAIRASVVRASVDGFLNPREIRVQRGELSPEGYYLDSFDYVSLVEQLLDPFVDGSRTVTTAAYDGRDDIALRPEAIPVPRKAVLVLDGVFLLRPQLRHWWTTSVYLHVAPEETLRRAAIRDVGVVGPPEVVHERYTRRYLPGQALYRYDADPQSVADVALDNTDPRAPVLLPRA